MEQELFQVMMKCLQKKVEIIQITKWNTKKMKIKDVKHFLLNPGWGKNLLFVKVITDNGLEGWGECYTQSDRDKTIIVHIEHMSNYLIGRDPFELKYFNII